jgi:diguanylate cyclase (GGDEF)-like protein
METLLVKEVMTQNPITIDASRKITSAIELMKVFDVGSVIVEENGKAVSIITKKDIIHILYHRYENMIISEFIRKYNPKKKLKTIIDSATVYDAMKLMEEEKIKHLPVIDKNGKVIGIITATDILRKVTHVAFVDPLTSVYNRRYIDVLYFKLRKRYNYVLMMIDIDNFKKINDNYGHPFGDKILRNLGNIILQSIRDYDDAIRYGGEEFLIVLYQTGVEEAMEIAEKIRKRFSNLKYEEAPELRVTVSVGIAQAVKGKGLWDTIKLADEALYKAKKLGRDRVEVNYLRR